MSSLTDSGKRIKGYTIRTDDLNRIILNTDHFTRHVWKVENGEIIEYHRQEYAPWRVGRRWQWLQRESTSWTRNNSFGRMKREDVPEIPMSFTQYINWRKRNAYQEKTIIPITYDRDTFYTFSGPMPRILEDWHQIWDFFVAEEADISQHETYVDVLI